MKQTAIIKSNRSGMTINLDPDAPIENILSELADKFDKSARFWGNTSVMLTLDGRKLSSREEMAIVNTITDHSQLFILGLIDTDEKNTENSDAALKRKFMEFNRLTGLFHTGNVESGEIISVEPSIVIIGDVYEGACIESSGNIIVLGDLSGTAKAGCCGDDAAVIVSFVLSTDDVSIDGISLRSSKTKYKKNQGPAAIMCENGTLAVKNIKKSFLSALNHKKCW